MNGGSAFIASVANDARRGAPTTLKVHVYNALRTAIVSGRYKPGSRLNESQLAREFNISRIPIREALMQLQEHGLVMNHERRGMFVTELSKEDVQRINSVRIVLEAEAMKLARANMTRQIAARLTKLVEKMESRRDLSEIDSAAHDLDFHRAIWEAANNPYLSKSLDSLSTVLFAHNALEHVVTKNARWRLNHHRELLNVTLGTSKTTPEQAIIDHLSAQCESPERFSSHAERERAPAARRG